jgi:hypothetical protein
LLETRLEFLKKDIDEIRTSLAQAKSMNLAPLFSIESEYRLAGLEMDLGFVEKLIARIAKDGCGFLKEWKAWHAQKTPRKKKG